jgi:CMP/dCMP kinase
MNLPEIIAIDGPAASGKSTVAERLAALLGYFFFDTGVMYRAVTWAALQQLSSLENEQAVTELAEKVKIDVQPPSQSDGRKYDVLVNGQDVTWAIRTVDVDANVSCVSAYAGVREAMTRLQRRIGQRGKTVMVGRDIGTVVFPDAKLKIYLLASAEERARRRFVEMQERGETTPYEEILESMRKRDEIDSTRIVAPLKPAEDAIQIDTDGLSIDQVVENILRIIRH